MEPRTTIQVRSARSEDVEQVRDLLRLADLPLDGLEHQFGENFAVAIEGTRVVGVEGIECYGQDGLLRSAAVDVAHRTHGIGGVLTRDRLAWARRQRLRAIYLLTTTAKDYFPRFGFVEVERTEAPEGIRQSREFADACPASATFMRLQLTENESHD